ncbi:MAG: shikimate dehydrogenase [Caulobacteraceae bacterium]|nr:shikimate dehydrogenase [Caulobacteraceae bacterium]
MSRPAITGATVVAGVAGAPVRHSLSPTLHNAWLASAGIDGVYVAFAPPADRFAVFVEGLRGGAVRGLNVTLPFKEEALALADEASDLARAAGAANVLVFETDGRIRADNTDGFGLLQALAVQAPGFSPAAAPAVVLGAGGAARGAVAALLAAGAPEVRVVNRTRPRAEAIAAALGLKVRAFGWEERDAAFGGAGALINATSLGLAGGQPLDLAIDALPPAAVVMDMVYKPLRTDLLGRAAASGRPAVDGLEMLIRQAMPSFEAFFGRPPPADIDARALALAALRGSA